MATQPLVLLVDDEYDLCVLMQMALSRIGIKTHIAHHLQQAKHFFHEYHYHACITDLNLPDGSALELVQYSAQHFPSTPIVVIRDEEQRQHVRDCLNAGAFDLLNKPIHTQHLQLVMQKALQRASRDARAITVPCEHNILMGESAYMQQLRQALKKIAQRTAPVLIRGESGTGKDVVARLIHQLSPRADGPFVIINCGALSEERIESELFGHLKGSFAGAEQNKSGLLQSAHQGSLFLDEVAELSSNMQVKLLRALQAQKIRPLGSEHEIEVDFRLLSASHQPLEHWVQQGRFRADLFYRLNVIDIVLPPLRDRGEDILGLAEFFITQCCQAANIMDKPLSKAAQRYLKQYHYPGNVRELRNMIERALSRCDEPYIDLVHLQNFALNPDLSNNSPNRSSTPKPCSQHHVQCASATQQATWSEILAIAATTSTPHSSPTPDARPPTTQLLHQIAEEGLDQFLQSIEREVLLNTLHTTRWNKTLAAKKLGMSFRSLRYRLKKLGLDMEHD